MFSCSDINVEIFIVIFFLSCLVCGPISKSILCHFEFMENYLYKVFDQKSGSRKNSSVSLISRTRVKERKKKFGMLMPKFGMLMPKEYFIKFAHVSGICLLLLVFQLFQSRKDLIFFPSPRNYSSRACVGWSFNICSDSQSS